MLLWWDGIKMSVTWASWYASLACVIAWKISIPPKRLQWKSLTLPACKWGSLLSAVGGFIEASHSCAIVWATSQNGKWLVMIANPSGKNEKVTSLRRQKLFVRHHVHQGRSELFICESNWLKGSIYICSFHRRNYFYKRPQCQRCTGLFN